MSQYTDQQQEFINYDGTASIILSATAGSGKTHSAVGRLNKLISDGVDPNRIIFFSFTNDAVDELQSRINAPVRITTIHSYTSSQLGKMGKFKKIASFYEFVAWYKEHKKPAKHDFQKKRLEFLKVVDLFYEEGNQISSNFAAYKLQTTDNFKIGKPKYYDDYAKFLRDTNSRDFTDLLIDTERLSKNPQYVHHFENTYDYVLIDEYQDTSTLQLKILLTIKAKQYYLIGDPNQSIYGFSGANCEAIQELLKSQREVVEFNLTKNFRSRTKIVEHSNKFSSLQAEPHATEDGLVEHALIDEFDLWEMIEDDRPLTILARTNSVIKEIEKECLKRKRKMKYFNFLTKQDISYIRDGQVNGAIKKKLEAVAPYHGNETGLLKFIEANKDSNTFITSIHKSKGREYPRVVVVNSFDPDQLKDTPDEIEDYSYIDANGDIDIEARNVHYVACTRPKEELYFLKFDV